MSLFAAYRSAIWDRMRLHGYSERTQEAYLRELAKLTEYFNTAPHVLTEAQIRQYLLYLKNHPRLGTASLKMAVNAIRYYLREILARDYAALPYIRIPQETRLPDVLSTHEVRDIVESERTLHHKTFLWTVYSLGLRLSEAVNLEVTHVDAGRRLVHVHRGKGARDRYVPLPSHTLQLLRDYWRTHRHPRFLFPGAPHNANLARNSPTPISYGAVQGALRLLVKRLRIRKRVSIHTLRHSYATHLMEAGVSLRLIQVYLGHRTLNSTMRYLHLTTRGQEYALDTIEYLMR